MYMIMLLRLFFDRRGMNSILNLYLNLTNGWIQGLDISQVMLVSGLEVFKDADYLGLESIIRAIVLLKYSFCCSHCACAELLTGTDNLYIYVSL